MKSGNEITLSGGLAGNEATLSCGVGMRLTYLTAWE